DVLKKERKKDRFRTIPLTYEVMVSIIDQIEQLNNRAADSFIFPASKNSERGEGISRQAVFMMIKNLSNDKINPHRLRHTFGTDLVDHGNDLRTVQDLMGHRHRATTEVYLHAREKRKESAIQTLDKPSFLEKIKRKLATKRRVDIIPMEEGTKFHVGRKEEQLRVIDLIEKKVNILIIGESGTGKTHQLDNIHLEKMWRMDEVSKMALLGMLLELNEGSKAKVLEKIVDNADIKKVITKDSIKRLCEILIKATEKYEYIIIVDRGELITKRGRQILEALKNHFHIIIAAREIKIQHKELVRNFEKIELKGLNRPEVTKLINLSSGDFMSRIEDYEAYKTHIWNKSLGNPGKIVELVERFRKEGNITSNKIHNIEFVSAMKEIDMLLPLLIFISSLMVLRYVGGELGDDNKGAFKLLGGSFMLVALFGRSLFTNARRKYV
ncbi:MAG: tyrosine-type recombinase/integrase, partial [Saprospiraceae bacterium]